MSPITSLQINDLKLLVHLGWTDKEREEKQMVRADINIHFLTPPKACTNDMLEDTWCYADVIEKIMALINAKQYRLVEYLCQEIHTLLKSLLPKNNTITVSITKHPVIKDFSGDVRFTYGD